MKILVLEPYDGGSHRRFLDQLEIWVDADYARLSLPARHWKWRMRLAAIHFAKALRAIPDAMFHFDLVLASTFLNLAELIALEPRLAGTPRILYWHENQLAYPNQVDREWDAHFAITNFVSGLAAQLNIFNSEFNRTSFLNGLPPLLKPAKEFDHTAEIETLARQSCVMPVPLDLVKEPCEFKPRDSVRPLVLWNHRWEHDKGPELFLQTMIDLAEEELEFDLAVVGQQFGNVPEVFAASKEKLRNHIVQWGETSSRQTYLALLRRSAVVVSTARHEFLGLSILEGLSQGAQPLVPDRLAYPEIYPESCRYGGPKEFKSKLREFIHKRPPLNPGLAEIPQRYSWSKWAPRFEQQFRRLANKSSG